MSRDTNPRALIPRCAKCLRSVRESQLGPAGHTETGFLCMDAGPCKESALRLDMYKGRPCHRCGVDDRYQRNVGSFTRPKNQCVDETGCHRREVLPKLKVIPGGRK